MTVVVLIGHVRSSYLSCMSIVNKNSFFSIDPLFSLFEFGFALRFEFHPLKFEIVTFVLYFDNELFLSRCARQVDETPIDMRSSLLEDFLVRRSIVAFQCVEFVLKPNEYLLCRIDLLTNLQRTMSNMRLCSTMNLPSSCRS
jgi:hypothetical protein